MANAYIQLPWVRVNSQPEVDLVGNKQLKRTEYVVSNLDTRE